MTHFLCFPNQVKFEDEKFRTLDGAVEPGFVLLLAIGSKRLRYLGRRLAAESNNFN